MRKEMWKLMMGLAMVLFSVSLASCGDDEDEVGSADQLVGTWNIIHDEGYHKEDGEVVKSWNDDYTEGKETIIFNENHTAGGTWLDDGMNWSYNGNKIKFEWEEYGEKDSEEITVLEMTSTRLVMEIYEKEKDSETTYEEYSKLTCTRASK